MQEGMRAKKNRGENKRELSTGGMLIPAYLAGRWLKYRYFYLQSGQDPIDQWLSTVGSRPKNESQDFLD